MDLQYSCHGSMWLLRHLTLAGEAWISEHLMGAVTDVNGVTIVEPRHIVGVVADARLSGLVVGSKKDSYSPR